MRLPFYAACCDTALLGVTFPGEICWGLLLAISYSLMWWDLCLGPVSLARRGQVRGKHGHLQTSSGEEKSHQAPQNGGARGPSGPSEWSSVPPKSGPPSQPSCWSSGPQICCQERAFQLHELERASLACIPGGQLLDAYCTRASMTTHRSFLLMNLFCVGLLYLPAR